MSKAALLLLLPVLVLRAEIHTLTLRQTVEQAMRQNPEIVMAHLDEEKSKQAVRTARDPFTPRIVVGSGLAYSSGYPMSIEGSAPSVFQAQATQFLFNRPQNYVVAQAKERARGATIASAGKRDEIAYRTTTLFLDAERAGRIAAMARKEVESLEKVAQTVQTQIEEGRVLPMEAKRAALNLARARQTVANIESDEAAAETSLALVLGFGADDLVRPAQEERAAPAVPESEDAAIQEALEHSNDLRQLQSQMAIKGLEIRAQRATRLPRVDLVAQYGLFAAYNHYQDYFRKFQRNNGQVGVSFQLPVLAGPGVGAATEQLRADTNHLRVEVGAARDRITADTRQNFRDIRRAESAREVAQLDLELTREQLSVLLAQMQEGKASLRQVEEARVAESGKWMVFYDAQYAVERARWALLRQTGDLLAAVR